VAQAAAKQNRLVLLGYGAIALAIVITALAMHPVSEFQFFAFRVLACLAVASLCTSTVKISLPGIHSVVLKAAVAVSAITVPPVATWYAYPVVFVNPLRTTGDAAQTSGGSPILSLVLLANGRLAGGGEDGKIKIWPKEGWGEPVILTHGHPVSALAALPDGRLASGGADGKIKIWPKDGVGEPVILPHGHPVSALAVLPDDHVSALAPGLDGSLWAGTDGGLARFDKDGHWHSYSKTSTQGGLPDDHVSALALGPDGSLWAGTRGGLARLDKDGHWQSYSKVRTQGGLPSDYVRALALGADDLQDLS